MTYLVLILVFLVNMNAAIDYTVDRSMPQAMGEPFNTIEDSSNSSETMPPVPTRRILKGSEVGDTRPYMVYLRAASNTEAKLVESHWLCGGVIIHKRYIITSAACVEDALHFQVISGTHKWVPPNVHDNACINNGAKKAVWKCVPKSYFFDGDNFDNIRWMVGDIAIVKVEDEFNFERKIRGCDFIPKSIKFNNDNPDLEKGGALASIAGWGSTEKFTRLEDEAPLRISNNAVELLETDVVLISKKGCMKRWDERYHFIINDEMICTKDSADTDHMNSVCQDRDIVCKGLEDSDDDYYNDEPKNITRTRMIIDPAEMIVHTAAHQDPTRRRFKESGGFCENDHGGPLIMGQGQVAVVIGIMSACLTNSLTNKCYGPYLFTSVYKYRMLISCVIDKHFDASCNSLLGSAASPVKETHMIWHGNHHIAFPNIDQLVNGGDTGHSDAPPTYGYTVALQVGGYDHVSDETDSPNRYQKSTIIRPYTVGLLDETTTSSIASTRVLNYSRHVIGPEYSIREGNTKLDDKHVAHNTQNEKKPIPSVLMAFNSSMLRENKPSLRAEYIKYKNNRGKFVLRPEPTQNNVINQQRLTVRDKNKVQPHRTTVGHSFQSIKAIMMRKYFTRLYK